MDVSESRPRRKSDLWVLEPSGRVRLLCDARLQLDQYELNSVAGVIWTLCDGARSVADIVRSVAGMHADGDVPIGVVHSDVIRLLESFEHDGLISWDRMAGVDVMLVVPPPPTGYSAQAVRTPEYSAPPLGLAYIAAVLRHNGFRATILDLHITGGWPEAIIAGCRKYNPTIIGITASTPTYPNASAMAGFVKAWKRDCITVIGGPHATCAPEECISSGVFDFVCIGEGEHSMLALARAILTGEHDPRSVSGFCVRGKDGLIKTTGPQQREVHLDSFPFPARDLLDLAAYHQRGSIVSSRGCAIGCDFCACSAIAGQTYRVHSIDYVVREMEHLLNSHQCRHFDFHDDTFNMHPSRVHDFCHIVRDRRLDVSWGCFCRAAQLSSQMAKDMVSAGCSVIQFGVESGNERVLQSLGKRTSLAQVEAAVSAASRAGVEQIVCGFVIGHAMDTEETICDTINFGLHLRDLGATRLTLSLLTPYPGTPVYENRDRLGVKLLTNDWEQYTFSRVVVETAHLSAEKLRQLYANGLLRFLDAEMCPLASESLGT